MIQKSKVKFMKSEVSAQKICPTCSEPNKNLSTYCANCGALIEEAVSNEIQTSLNVSQSSSKISFLDFFSGAEKGGILAFFIFIGISTTVCYLAGVSLNIMTILALLVLALVFGDFIRRAINRSNVILTFYDASDNSIIGIDTVLGGSGTASVSWSGLSAGTMYSWFVIASDSLSPAQSDTWSFTTNYMPDEPANPSPNDGATNIDFNPTLSVEVFDNDGDDLTISFYNASDDTIIGIDTVLGGSGTASVSWSGLSAGTTYFWYITVDDNSNPIQSDTWSFTTNYVPGEPVNPSPNDGASDIDYSPILSVDVFDNDGDDLILTFYNASDNSIIGIDSVLGGSGTASVSWLGLSPGTYYSWYVIVEDSLSNIQSNSWSFTTNYIPNEPYNPIPNDGAVNIDFSPALSVNVSDNDGDHLIITFYNASDDTVIGTDTVLGGGGIASVLWSSLSAGTTYSWYAIVDDGLSINRSITCTFTTLVRKTDIGGGGGGGSKEKESGILDDLTSPVVIALIGVSTSVMFAGVVSYLFFKKRKLRLT